MLLKYLLGKEGEIDAPITPQMATVVLEVFVLIALGIKISTILFIGLVEEVGFPDGYPVELGCRGEETVKLGDKLGMSG